MNTYMRQKKLHIFTFYHQLSFNKSQETFHFNKSNIATGLRDISFFFQFTFSNLCKYYDKYLAKYLNFYIQKMYKYSENV